MTVRTGSIQLLKDSMLRITMGLYFYSGVLIRVTKTTYFFNNGALCTTSFHPLPETVSFSFCFFKALLCGHVDPKWRSVYGLTVFNYRTVRIV